MSESASTLWLDSVFDVAVEVGVGDAVAVGFGICVVIVSVGVSPVSVGGLDGW